MSSTTHLHLNKPSGDEFPNINEAVNNNMDVLDSEVWSRGKTFNGEPVGEDGGFHVDRIKYAENLESSATQKSNDEFIFRTSGGGASISDGPAWLMLLKGRMTHTGYVPMSATMTVSPMPREEGDPITATIDEETFAAEATDSGTYSFTYSTGWSTDPADYGITVTGTPIAGDAISVVYVKEVRGTITQSNPQTLVSTGWNLYNHSNGYARVKKYSDTYGFKVAGTYTALEFATTTTGTRTGIIPVNDGFTIPSDGYVFVTGGNDASTAIWMTWEDWVSGYKWDGTQQGSFDAYSQTVVDLSSYMSSNFPYGLLAVGDVYDEINLNIGVAVSRVERLSYNAENLATAEASGRAYEYDENYIYLERETPVEYACSVDGGYTANDHGEEYFTGTGNAVYAECIYGNNLKNKLEMDVVELHQGVSNAGKFLVVGSDGIVAPTTVPSAQGVSF